MNLALWAFACMGSDVIQTRFPCAVSIESLMDVLHASIQADFSTCYSPCNCTEAKPLRDAISKSASMTSVNLSGNLFGRDLWESLGKGYMKLSANVK